jgi:hypothetical protein
MTTTMPRNSVSFSELLDHAQQEARRWHDWFNQHTTILVRTYFTTPTLPEMSDARFIEFQLVVTAIPFNRAPVAPCVRLNSSLQQHPVRFLSIASLEFRFRGYNLANFRRVRFRRIISASNASDAPKRYLGWGVRSPRDAYAEDMWGAACVLEVVG